MSTNQTPAPVANLRDARKQMAAAKKAHPAGKRAPAKAPAKAAPAKPAAKAPAKPSTKITWKTAGEKDKNGDAPATGTLGDKTYEIARSGDGKFTATVKVGKGKPTVLAENVSGKTYWAACVKHSKGVAA